MPNSTPRLWSMGVCMATKEGARKRKFQIGLLDRDYYAEDILAVCKRQAPHEGGNLILESRTPVIKSLEEATRNDIPPIRTYDFVLALRGNLQMRNACIILSQLDGRLIAEERIVGALSPARADETKEGTWILNVARGVEPEMLLAAVDAWDEIVRLEQAELVVASGKRPKEGGKKRKGTRSVRTQKPKQR